VLTRLRDKGIKCHPEKMRIAEPDVAYLGHPIVPGGTAPQQIKVEAIVKMSPPTDEPELKVVLGTANYYKKFVKDYSTIAAMLNNLLRSDVAWNWSATRQNAFDMLKGGLQRRPYCGGLIIYGFLNSTHI
jgi:hypothetical protein